jgi:hypothetical protein
MSKKDFDRAMSLRLEILDVERRIYALKDHMECSLEKGPHSFAMRSQLHYALWWAQLAAISSSEEEWHAKIFHTWLGLDSLLYVSETVNHKSNPRRVLEVHYERCMKAGLKSINIAIEVRWDCFRDDVLLQTLKEEVESRDLSGYTSGLHAKAAVEVLQAKRSALMESFEKLPFYCRDPVLVTF